MAKHRKSQHAHRISPTSRRSKSNASTPWRWLMMGMLIGTLGITAIFLFVTGKWPLNKFNLPFNVNPLIRESNAILPNSTTIKNSRKPKSTEAPHSKTQAPQKESARFEFYQLLPGMEVPLPETTKEIVTHTSKPTLKPALAKTETKLAAAQYLVQAGNFRALVNAESLKERLHLQGLFAKIQKIDAENGVWFRVTLGPFPSETIALSQKSRLAKEKIPGILILQRQ
jgi:cell division septation protein DedD